MLARKIASGPSLKIQLEINVNGVSLIEVGTNATTAFNPLAGNATSTKQTARKSTGIKTAHYHLATKDAHKSVSIVLGVTKPRCLRPVTVALRDICKY